MKKLIFLVLAIIVVSGCVGQAQETASDETETVRDDLSENVGPVSELSNIESGKAKIVFVITDSFLDIDNVDSVLLTIGKVELRKEDGKWSSISLQPRTYDLISLKGVDRFLGEANMYPGIYDQVRLTISNAIVVTDGKPKTTTLPSNTMVLAGKLVLTADKTAYVRIDFVPEQSVHETSSGKLIFAPVVNYQTWREAIVTLDGVFLNREGGHKLSDKTLGMDISGDVGNGVQVSGDDNLAIDENGKIVALEKEEKKVVKVVQISNFYFGPGSVRISVGDTVKWINNDDVMHTIDFVDIAVESGNILKGENWEYTFTEEGIFDYTCFYYPYMAGKIYVE